MDDKYLNADKYLKDFFDKNKNEFYNEINSISKHILTNGGTSKEAAEEAKGEQAINKYKFMHIKNDEIKKISAEAAEAEEAGGGNSINPNIYHKNFGMFYDYSDTEKTDTKKRCINFIKYLIKFYIKYPLIGNSDYRGHLILVENDVPLFIDDEELLIEGEPDNDSTKYMLQEKTKEINKRSRTKWQKKNKHKMRIKNLRKATDIKKKKSLW